MSVFSLSEVVAVLGLSQRSVQGLVRSGYVTPKRGPRRKLHFSFQDIVVLKTAHALMQDAVSRRKITRAIRALRQQLPTEMPLAGLRVRAAGDDVVVQAKSQMWEPTSGQGVLSFELVRHEDQLRVLEPSRKENPDTPIEDWFALALDLEATDPAAAAERYQRIIEADKRYIDAYINWGRLLHEANDLAAAEKLYRDAISTCDACAALNYNLGVLLEDVGRIEEAVTAYQQALQCDPDHCDSHHNLARLYELTNRSQHAIRHFNHYRALSRRGGRLHR